MKVWGELVGTLEGLRPPCHSTLTIRSGAELGLGQEVAGFRHKAPSCP
jgi:hypothetical protein